MGLGNGAMHRTQIFLPLELHQTLKKEADFRQTTISDLIRDMLNRQLRISTRNQTERGVPLLLDMAQAA